MCYVLGERNVGTIPSASALQMELMEGVVRAGWVGELGGTHDSKYARIWLRFVGFYFLGFRYAVQFGSVRFLRHAA